MKTDSSQGLDPVELLKNWQSPRLLLAALFLTGLLALSSQDKQVINQVELPILFKALTEVDSLTLKNGLSEVQLKKVDNNWVISNNHNYQADAPKVEALIQALRDIAPARLATRTAERFQSFLVHDGGFTISAFNNGVALGSVLLGRPGVDSKTLFIRVPGQKQAFIAGPNSSTFQNKTLISWMQKQLLSGLEITSIQRVVFTKTGADSQVILSRTPGHESGAAGKGWRIDQPIQHPARERSMEKLLGDLAAVSLSYAADPAAPNTVTGFDKPTTQVDLIMTSGKVNSLIVGRLDRNAYYIKSTMRSGIFKVPSYLAENLVPNAESLRENDLVAFSQNEIRQLSIKKANVDCMISRGKPADPWRMKLPEEGDCDRAGVQKILKFMTGMRFIEKIVKPDLKTYGLDKPTLVLLVRDLAGRTQQVSFGQVKKLENDDREVVYVRKDADLDVFVVDSRGFKALKTDVRDLRGSLFNFSSRKIINMVRQINKVGQNFFQRDANHNWFGTLNKKLWFRLDSKKVSKLLRTLAQFKQGQLSPEQNIDKVKLRQPRVAWFFQLESKARHALYIGNPLANGKIPIVTERLRPIYLVDKKDIEDLELNINEDLRDKKLFDLQFSERDLNELVLSRRKSGQKLTLRRSETGNWSVATPPMPADNAKIRKLVTSLAGLTAKAINTKIEVRKKLVDDYEFEARLLLRNMTAMAIWIGPLRPDGTRMVAKPVSGTVDVAYQIDDEDAQKIMLSASDLRTTQLIGPAANKITSIRILPTGKPSRELKLSDGKIWTFKSSEERVDQNAVNGLISQLAMLQPEKKAKVASKTGLSKPLAQLILEAPGAKFTIKIGAPGPTPGTRHIQFLGSKEVHVVRCYIFEQLLTINPDYVDFKLVSGYYNTFKKVTWTLKQGRIVLEKNPTTKQWKMTEPGNKKTDVGGATQHLSMLANLRAMKLTPSVAAINSANFTMPESMVRIDRDSGPSVILKFSKQTEPGRRLVLSSDRKKPLYVHDSTFKSTLPVVKKLEDLSVFSCDINKITDFSIKLRSVPLIEFRVSEGLWFGVEEGKIADRNSILRMTGCFRIIRREDGIPPELKGKVGFDNPLLTMTIKIGAKTTTMVVGKLDKVKRVAYLKLNGGEGFITGINSFYHLDTINSGSFVNKVISQLNDRTIKKLTFKKDGASVTIEKKGRGWVLNPGEHKLSALDSNPIFQPFRSLRADRLAPSNDVKKEGFSNQDGTVEIETTTKTYVIDLGRSKNRERLIRFENQLFIIAYDRIENLVKSLQAQFDSVHKKKAPKKAISPSKAPEKAAPNGNVPRNIGPAPKKNPKGEKKDKKP
jgi:hypothetical protein